MINDASPDLHAIMMSSNPFAGHDVFEEELVSAWTLVRSEQEFILSLTRIL